MPASASEIVASKSWNKETTFFEVLYNPFPTQGLKRAQEIGSQVIDGMQLLVEQALDQIQLFSGLDFDFDLMRRNLLGVGRAQL